MTFQETLERYRKQLYYLPWLILALLAIIIGVGIIASFRTQPHDETTKPETPIERQNKTGSGPLSHWENYFRLMSAFSALQQKCLMIGTGTPASPDNLMSAFNGEENDAGDLPMDTAEAGDSGWSLDEQVRTLLQNLNMANTFDQSDLDQTTDLYRQILCYNRDARVKSKRIALEGAREREYEAKKLENKLLMERYSKSVKEEYQVKLTNLQLKLSIVSLPENKQDEALEKQIQEEIRKTHLEIEAKIVGKEKELSVSLEQLRRSRLKEDSDLLEAYQNALTTEMDEELNRYREKLSLQLAKRRQEREIETATAVSLREKFSSLGYNNSAVK